MKKLTLTLLLALSLLLVATTAALAATTDYTYDKDSGIAAGTYNGDVEYVAAEGDVPAHYTASYTGADLDASGFYALIVLKTTLNDSNIYGTSGDKSYTVGVDTIMYIDQALEVTGADANKTVSFNFIPKGTPDCVVLLAGTGFDEPVALGALEGKGVTISGTLTYFGNVTQPTMTLKDSTNNSCGNLVLGTADVNDENQKVTRTFTITGVPVGTHTLAINKLGHLAYSKAIAVDADDIDFFDIDMLAGDITDANESSGSGSPDSLVNFWDLSSILDNYQNPSAVESKSNINEDGYVNFWDLSLVLDNYQATPADY